ncbi:T9SS type A sorting domain-containing protein [candidate division TA06 bacterium]|nr:T9SS type A sorting domain-containing protein [candidate division TA06 bacterium]
MKIKVFSFLLYISIIGPTKINAEVWRQTNWAGGSGQEFWADSTMYSEGSQINGAKIPGDLLIDYPAWVSTGPLIGGRDVFSLIEGFDGALYAGTSLDAKIFKSTNWGASWDTTGSLLNVYNVHSLLQGSDSALYEGTSINGDVFRSTDWGVSWQNTGDLVNAFNVFSLIESNDGSLYAGIDSPDTGKVVFKSTNGGASWDTTGDLDVARLVYCLIQGSDGSLYAGTGFYLPRAVFKSTDSGFTWTKVWDSPAGNVQALLEGFDGSLFAGTAGGFIFKSTDGGLTWIDMGRVDPPSGILSFLQASDSTIYAGGDQYIFKSTNWGVTWVQTEPLPAGWVEDMIEGTDGHLYSGLSNPGGVYKSAYFDSGYLISSIFDTGDWGTIYGVMDWNEILFGQSLVMKVRTSLDSLMAGAVPWDSASPVIKGQDISSLASVNDGDRYVQYRVELITSDLDVTPVLHEVTIFFSSVGVEEISELITPNHKVSLLQNSPNPFPQFTSIQYQLSNQTFVTLWIYDLTGRLVKTLIESEQKAGKHRIIWNGKDLTGRTVSSGIYFYQLEINSEKNPKKITKKTIKMN